MNELGYIDKEKYELVAFTIKENMEEFLENLDDYDNGKGIWDYL